MIRCLLIDLGDTLIEQKVDNESPLSQLELIAFPDAKPAMSELKAYGYLIAIVSNTFQSSANDVAKALEKLGLMEYVDVIVTSYDVGVEKPHPKVYLTALEKLGLPINAAMMIGDDVVKDVGGASELGIATVLLKRQSTSIISAVAPTFIVSSLLEIPPLVESYNKKNENSTDSQNSSPENFEKLAQIAQDQLMWNDAARYHVNAAKHYLSRHEHEKAASHYARAARCLEQNEDWREIGELWLSASTTLAKSQYGDILRQPYEDFDASRHFFMGIDPKTWDNLPLTERIGRAFRYAGYHLEKAGNNQSAYNQYYTAGRAFEQIKDWEQAGRAFFLATISFIRQYGELNHQYIKRLENACEQGQLQDQMKYLNRMLLYYRRIGAELRAQGNDDDQEKMYIKLREVSRTLALKKRKPQEWSALTLWKLTSNYGTDFWRWLIWTVILACGIFPTLYKMLNLLSPQPYTWFDSLYFSIAAFVTLSYFDFAPIGWGRVIALSETVIGLFMLGSLLTLLVNKFAR